MTQEEFAPMTHVNDKNTAFRRSDIYKRINNKRILSREINILEI